MQKLRTVSLAIILLVGSTSLMYLNSCKKAAADPCKGVTCQNGGTCTSGTCSCPNGYSGSDCSTNLTSTVVGTYNDEGDQSGGVTELLYNATINATATVGSVTINNMCSWEVGWNTSTVNATVDFVNKKITVPSQDPNHTGYPLSAVGTYTINTTAGHTYYVINWTFTFTATSTGQTLVFTGQWSRVV